MTTRTVLRWFKVAAGIIAAVIFLIGIQIGFDLQIPFVQTIRSAFTPDKEAAGAEHRGAVVVPPGTSVKPDLFKPADSAENPLPGASDTGPATTRADRAKSMQHNTDATPDPNAAPLAPDATSDPSAVSAMPGAPSDSNTAPAVPEETHGGVSPNSSSPFEYLWLALGSVVVLLFVWTILLLRRRLDETTEVVPLLNMLQKMLGLGQKSGGARQFNAAGGETTLAELFFALSAECYSVANRVDHLEKWAASLGAVAQPGRTPASSAGSGATLRPPSSDWLRTVEDEYANIFAYRSVDEMERFAEERSVKALREADGGLEFSDDPPSSAWFWLVENPQLRRSLVFPGRRALEQLGSLAADGASGMRQLLGRTFDIQYGQQTVVIAAQLQPRGNADDPVILATKGRIVLTKNFL